MKTRIVKVGLDAIACAVLVWPHPMLALVPVARTTEGYDKRTELRAHLQVPVDRPRRQRDCGRACRTYA
jgi:hypothetical protein